MKIYATSDMHGNLDGLDPSGCDVVVIAGDFAPLRNIGKWHWHDQKKWIREKFVPWTQEHPEAEFVVVPGNHDFCLDASKTSLYRDLSWSVAWPDNVRLLVNSAAEAKGLRVYGTPNVPIISRRWAFETEHDGLVRAFSKIPAGLDVLVAHTPPRIDGSDVDRSMQWGGTEAFGSAELAQAVFEKKPRYVFCGHIHTGDHRPVRFGESVVYNVSRVDEDYKPAFEPAVLEIPDRP